eukprot:SAG31_NODE_1774_length_7303_cov_4.685453_6_plen_358_part_00
MNVIEIQRMQKSKLAVDEAGYFTFERCAPTDERYKSELYNEQISLLCNTEGARMLHSLGAEAPIYRAQPPPTEDMLKAFEDLVRGISKQHLEDEETWAWHRYEESLAEYLRRLHLTHGDDDHLVQVIDRQAARSTMKAAKYTIENQDHHQMRGLYARFSSPMRQLWGCFLHFELRETIFGRTHPVKTIKEVQRRLINLTIDSKRKEKRINGSVFGAILDSYFLHDLEQMPPGRFVHRPKYTGFVIGITVAHSEKDNPTMYIQLNAPALEIKVHVHDLNHQHSCQFRAPLHQGVNGTFGQRGQALCLEPHNFVSQNNRLSPPAFFIGQKVTVCIRDKCTFMRERRRDRWVFSVYPAVG